MGFILGLQFFYPKAAASAWCFHAFIFDFCQLAPLCLLLFAPPARLLDSTGAAECCVGHARDQR